MHKWYRVDTDHPVALDSPDHLEPLGTMQDNSVNLLFNEKLLALCGERVRVLDLGCAGGGMVESMVAMGMTAIGIEGSDYSLKHKRAGWATVPDYLFTADARKPFAVMNGRYPLMFDVVTAWEFFEHIGEEDLVGVFENIHKHLVKGGFLIASINTKKSGRPKYHLTVRDAEWWKKLLEGNGFGVRHDLWNYFDPDWVRVCRYSVCLVMGKV